MRAHPVHALLLVAIFIAWSTIPASAGYLAVSLGKIESAVQSGHADATVTELGGVNRILGMVVDPAGELLLIGRHDPAVPPLTVDHLAVALRAVYVVNAYPLVSLDGTADTPATGLLRVRFEGGVQQTRFGNDLLQADLVLKRLALGLLPARLWNVPSYLDLSAQAKEASAAHTRFWFVPKDQARLLQRDGVFIIRRLDIAVRTETVGGTADPPATQFAADLEGAFPDVAAVHAELARVKPLFDVVALAAAIKSVKPADAMQFWLRKYNPALVATPETYSMLHNGQKSVRVEGGIDLEVLSAGIVQGDTSALRQAVLLSRPSPDAASWPVPLADWPIDSGTISAADAEESAGRASLARHAGTSVFRQRPDKAVSAASAMETSSGSSGVTAAGISHATGIPSFTQVFYRSPPPPASIGGVWLAGTARPSLNDAVAGAADGGFSLLVDGGEGMLPADRFARFVTALWAVYLSPTPPGVSIDPMGPGLPKHLVRYIGDVVNSDLARVMRESDYLMKQLAVGSTGLDVPGFKDVDRLSGLRGLTYAGASRRFWFVPENLRFSTAAGALRFNDGHMTLKTEYVQTGGKKIRAEQADIDFATFFTRNYDAIAARRPIFRDLLEYAKLVGLASYLKQQRIPLLWFLLANRDRVLTEDFPGTVAAIVRQSRVFAGARIEGGVDLRPTGRYIPDAEVIAALRRAAANETPGTPGTAAPRIAPAIVPASVSVGDRQYTVVPQTSAAAGRDSDGRRYQTDIALRRADGLPGLELVRYYDPARRDVSGIFGDGWSLLVPYRIEPAEGGHRDFRNARIPEGMIVRALVSGESEELTFSDDRYDIAGWVPEKGSKSKLLGLFPLSDGSFRLVDKLGANMAFDRTGELTDLMLSSAYQMRFERTRRLAAEDFIRPPYQLEHDGNAVRQIGDMRLPTRMRLSGPRGEELLALNMDIGLPGYYPVNPNSRVRVLALLSGGDLRLLDQSDNEFAFDPQGHFSAMLLAHSVVKRLSQDTQNIAFRFFVGRNGDLLTGEATTAANPSKTIRYDYDLEERVLVATAF